MRARLATMRRARSLGGRGRRMLGAGCAVAGLAVLAAACGPASSSTTGATAGSTNTVTYAMQPGGLAQYPFPFLTVASSDFDSVFNINDFQYLVYRPLYWFGTGVTPYMNPQLSLAEPPVYHGHQVIIKLKPGWKWSNGQPV